MNPPFVDRLLWQREGRTIRGSGGWRFAFWGEQRLAQMDALWQRLIVAADQPLTAFLAATFDDSSALPSVLRIPAELDIDGVSTRQWIADGLLSEVAGDQDNIEVGPAGSLHAPGQTLGRSGHRALIESALSAIDRADVRKVVVGRDAWAAATDETSWRAVNRLAANYPKTWTFTVDGLFGATPELLLARAGDRVRTRVLAGTADNAGLLRTDPRRVSEHRLAADAVLSELGTVAKLDDERPEPYVLQLPNLWHLATDISGIVPQTQASSLQLVQLLHPTPAVAGVPTTRAIELINQWETRDRGRYAGPVGWIDSHGNAEIGIALRCAQRESDGVRLYAAGGIVAGADPDWEYAETEAKLAPVRDALAE